MRRLVRRQQEVLCSALEVPRCIQQDRELGRDREIVRSVAANQ